MIQGSLVALVTPMLDDGSVDSGSLAQLIEFHIENGTDGIVAVGTTGESATLDEKEHCEVVRQVVEMVAGRIPVIAGTGSNSTREAISLTQCAKQAGVDACLLVTPYYNKPTQEGLYQHYKAVAEAVDIPQILYNVPGRTSVDMLTETVVRLSKVKNIVGVKEATGDIQRAKDILAQCGNEFALYSGDDATGMEFMLSGGHGVISVTSNVAPRTMHEMCVAAIAGDRETATLINDRLMGLHNKLFVEANPIPVKWALYEMGLIPNGIRLPLTVLSDSQHDVLRQAMQQAGVI
ncbi:MAG: 4-hydroxy-tetrahydrodipicolinate synthase [Gammaproteobacteria bacterium]|nr:4-hydroxy-tetrahydrodipicolinate synthase [Gammaproteobacteria bacterium]